MNKTEEYVVKFWLKKPEEEFIKQCSESVWFSSKGRHKQAEKEILDRYRNDGCRIEIISVTYK